MSEELPVLPGIPELPKKRKVRKKRIKVRKNDKTWLHYCQLCKKELVMIHRESGHFVEGELVEKPKRFGLSVGVLTCPFCRAKFALIHRGVGDHILEPR